MDEDENRIHSALQREAGDGRVVTNYVVWMTVLEEDGSTSWAYRVADGQLASTSLGMLRMAQMCTEREIERSLATGDDE